MNEMRRLVYDILQRLPVEESPVASDNEEEMNSDNITRSVHTAAVRIIDAPVAAVPVRDMAIPPIPGPADTNPDLPAPSMHHPAVDATVIAHPTMTAPSIVDPTIAVHNVNIPSIPISAGAVSDGAIPNEEALDISPSMVSLHITAAPDTSTAVSADLPPTTSTTANRPASATSSPTFISEDIFVPPANIDPHLDSLMSTSTPLLLPNSPSLDVTCDPEFTSPPPSKNAKLPTSSTAGTETSAATHPAVTLQPPTPQNSLEAVGATPHIPILLSQPFRKCGPSVASTSANADAAPGPAAAPSLSLKPPSEVRMTRSRSLSTTPPSPSPGKRKADNSGAGQAGKHHK